METCQNKWSNRYFGCQLLLIFCTAALLFSLVAIRFITQIDPSTAAAIIHHPIDYNKGFIPESHGLTDRRGSPTRASVRLLTLAKLAQRSWSECPSWISEFEEEHQREALKGSQGRYMIHACGDKTALYCAGIGDRIRAMMETARLAKYARRAVLFTWKKPSALEDVLQPAGGIDWRVKPSYMLGSRVRGQVDYIWSTWIPWTKDFKKPPDLADGTYAAIQSRVITISSNFLDQG